MDTRQIKIRIVASIVKTKEARRTSEEEKGNRGIYNLHILGILHINDDVKYLVNFHRNLTKNSIR